LAIHPRQTTALDVHLLLQKQAHQKRRANALIWVKG